ncbi:MAG: SRPBCC family protein [Chloroflexota bacterium]|nr:SRPBCC family protein [Chloroflexota bacterium]
MKLAIQPLQRKTREPLPLKDLAISARVRGITLRERNKTMQASQTPERKAFPPFQSRQEVVIHAPLPVVWEFNQDLTNIAVYHPRVKRVELISGKSQRGPGVAYRCYLKDGKNTCVEKDIEVVPMERVITTLPEDTMGITTLLPDYLVEAKLTPLAEDETKVEFRHYYSTKSLKAKLLNVIVKKKIARESQDTLDAIKRAIEKN